MGGRTRRWVPAVTVALVAAVLGGCRSGDARPRPSGVVRLDRSVPVARVDVPLSMRRDALVVAAGREVLVIGGRAPGIKDPGRGGRIREARYLADGARLDLRSGRWWSIPPIPAGPLHDPQGVWTGEELVVVGSPCGPGSGWLVDAEPPEKVCRPGGLWVGAYSPRRKRWRTIERRSAASKGSETAEDVPWEVYPRGRAGRTAVFTTFLYRRVGGHADRLLGVDPERGTVRWLPRPFVGTGDDIGSIEGPCGSERQLLVVNVLRGRWPPSAVTPRTPLRVLRLDPEAGRWVQVAETPRPVTDRQDSEVSSCGQFGIVYLPVSRTARPALGTGGLWWDRRAGGWERLPPIPIHPEIRDPWVVMASTVHGHKVLMLSGGTPTTDRDSLEAWFVLAPGAREWWRIAAPFPLRPSVLAMTTTRGGIAAGWMVVPELSREPPRPGEAEPALRLSLVNVDHLIGRPPSPSTSAPPG